MAQIKEVVGEIKQLEGILSELNQMLSEDSPIELNPRKRYNSIEERLVIYGKQIKQLDKLHQDRERVLVGVVAKAMGIIKELLPDEDENVEGNSQDDSDQQATKLSNNKVVDEVDETSENDEIGENANNSMLDETGDEAPSLTGKVAERKEGAANLGLEENNEGRRISEFNPESEEAKILMDELLGNRVGDDSSDVVDTNAQGEQIDDINSDSDKVTGLMNQIAEQGTDEEADTPVSESTNSDKDLVELGAQHHRTNDTNDIEVENDADKKSHLEDQSLDEADRKLTDMMSRLDNAF